MHESILIHRRFLYLKIAACLSLVTIGLYVAHRPLVTRGGDTWLGYALGVLGAAMILWLLWFGVRKRRYGGDRLPLNDWLSAHVYLGLSLVVVVTLHTGFQFGWNVHTAAYVVMLIVIASGVVGVVAYRRYPNLLTDIQRGEELETILQSIADIDGECRELLSGQSDAIARAVLAGIDGTRIGGSLLRLLLGPRAEDAATHALDEVRRVLSSPGEEPTARAEQLIRLLRHKRELVERAQRVAQIRTFLRIWLYAHVPLSMALIVALFGHVVAVFFYR